MKTYTYVLAITALGLMSGCAETTTTPIDTSPSGSENATSQTPATEDTPALDDVKKELSEAAEVTETYASEEIQEYADSLNDKLQDLDAQFEQLKQKGDELAGDAKQQWEDQLKTLQEKRNKIGDDLRTLRDASGDAWQDLKEGLNDAWDDLQKTADEAAKHFDETRLTGVERKGGTE